MMRVLLVLVLLQVLYVSQSTQEPTDLLKVSIYYESLCPDSVRFIVRQLYPAYKIIGSSLKLHFVPYGKALQNKENGIWKFECQHGPDECWGNKAQACGLAEEKGQDKDVEFVNCVMSQPYPADEEVINLCAPRLGLTGRPLLECANSTKGDELLAKHGDETHGVDPLITFIPTIIFNDKYDYDLQSGALSNFLKTACDLLVKKPQGCPSENFMQ